METPLIKACDGVWEAMFWAEFTKEEIEVLKALKGLIDDTLNLYERKEAKDE